MSEQKIVRNAARCKLCGDVVESKHRHDFRFCSCESIFVDGGKDYLRRGGNLEHYEDVSEFEGVASKEPQKSTPK